MFNDNLLVFANSYNIIQLMAGGSFPLRDPYLYMDLIRASNVSILYWPHTLFYIIGVVFFSTNVEILRLLWLGLHFIHICFPSFAMYLLLRYCKFDRWACIFGAIVYGWNFYMMVMGGLYTAHIRAVHMAVIPLVWLIAMYSLYLKKYYLNVLSGLLINWAILAGGLQPVIYIIPFVSLYLFFGVLSEKPFSVINVFRAIYVPLLIIVSMLLCIFPVVVTGPEILPYLNRFDANPTPQLFSVGGFFYGLIEPFFQWKEVFPFPWESVRYFGFVAFLLLILGFGATLKNLFNKRSSFLDKLFLSIFIFSFVICVWYPYLPQWILNFLLFQKGFSRYPFRIYPIVMFAISFFTAKGISYFRDADIRHNKIDKYSVGITLIMATIFFAIKMFFHEPVLGGNLFFMLSSLIVFLSLFCIVFVYFKPKFIWLLVITIICDLGLIGYIYCDNRYQFYNLAEQDFYKYSFLRIQDTSWISHLPKKVIPYRVLIVPDEYDSENEVNRETGYIYHKLRHPFGYCGSTAISKLDKFRDIKDIEHPIFDILGVKFFHICKTGGASKPQTSQDVSVESLISNKDAMPLIYALNKVKFFDNSSELFKEVYKGNDEIKNVIYFSLQDLGSDVNLVSKFLNTADRIEPVIKADSIIYKAEKVAFSVLNPQDTILILSEPWFPFWRAYIDGKQTKIYQAYGLIQAILLPRGCHYVSFEYTSPFLFIFVSIVSQIAIIIFLIVYFGKFKIKKINFRVIVSLKNKQKLKYLMFLIFLLILFCFYRTIVVPAKHKNELYSNAVLTLPQSKITNNKYTAYPFKVMFMPEDLRKTIYYFNGKDSYVTTSLSLKNLKGFSIMFWVKPDKEQTSNIVTILDNGHDEKQNFCLQSANIIDSTYTLHCFGLDSIFELPSDGWTLVLINVGLEGKFCVYLNGKKQSCYGLPQNYKFGPTPLTFGKLAKNNERYFKGAIDEIIVWDRALNEQEIKLLFVGLGLKDN